ncbi:MAG TPA: dienelactone hydrolase family protein [Solirubrobacterales bacterium]
MCFELDAQPPDLPADRVLPSMAGGAAAESLTLTSGDGIGFAAALAESADPRGPAVLVLPDIRGLYRFYVELAERLAEAGHDALAFDYFGRSAGAEPRGEDFDYMEHVPQTTPEGVMADLAAARAALVERTGAAQVVTLGFCFGGTYSFFAGTRPELELTGAIGFYGLLNPSRSGKGSNRPSMIEHAPELTVPVLGLFGGADQTIPEEDVAAFDRGLEQAGVPHEITVYPGAPHSFFDKKSAEFADASADAWARLLDFLDRLPAPAAV